MNSIPIHGLSAITAPFGHDRTPIHDFRLATAYRIVVVQWRSSIAAACHYRLFKSCRLIVIRRNKMKKIRYPMWIVMEMVRAHCAAADLKCCILLWQVTQIFDVNFFPNHFLLVFFFFSIQMYFDHIAINIWSTCIFTWDTCSSRRGMWKVHIKWPNPR